MTTTLTKGARYVATATAMRNGARTYRTVTFTAARGGEPEPFFRTGLAPDQDRVFVERDGSSIPALFVAGSIVAATR